MHARVRALDDVCAAPGDAAPRPPGSICMALDTADAMPGHRWVLAGCLLLLLGLFAMLALSLIHI